MDIQWAFERMGPVLHTSVRFLTTWTLVLVICHEHTHAHVHLLLLTFLVAVGGIVLTYMDPKFVRVGDAVVTGIPLRIMDVALHHLPFLFVCWRYGPYYAVSGTRAQMMAVVAIIVLYLLLVDPVEMYQFSECTLRRLQLAAAGSIALSLACGVGVRRSG